MKAKNKTKKIHALHTTLWQTHQLLAMTDTLKVSVIFYTGRTRFALLLHIPPRELCNKELTAFYSSSHLNEWMRKQRYNQSRDTHTHTHKKREVGEYLSTLNDAGWCDAHGPLQVELCAVRFVLPV